MFNSNQVDIVEDVATLRNQLRLTEISLQSLGEQLSQSGHDSHSKRCDESPVLWLPGRLTLEDLQPNAIQTSPEHPSVERVFSPPSTESRYFPSRSRGEEMEAAPLRKKLGGLRQENASLATENRQLISDLEAAHIELSSSKTKARPLGSTIGVNAFSVAIMREQIHNLEAEMDVQARELRAAELNAEQSQQAAAQSERQATGLREELSMLRTELSDTTRQLKRAEQQRNQALCNAEKLTDAFKDYKANISVRLKKAMESESKLKESLIVCDRERGELENKCASLEKERREQGQHISNLTEDLTQARTLNTRNLELQGHLEEAAQRASRLEVELGERASATRELASLRRETEDLRTLTQCQEQRLSQCQREAQQSQAELADLESILTLLHLREGNEGPLCVKPCMLPPVGHTGTTELLRLKPGELYQQLLPALQAVEAERDRQSTLASRLQERLLEAQEEVSSLHSSMAQRASHYQQLHSELLERASQAVDAQKELKRKVARVAALEKQLQEKSSAYSQAALKNGQLEQELLEKASSIQHYQSVMTKKQKDFQQALDKCEKARSDQCEALQGRVDEMQFSLDQTQGHVSELEQALRSAEGERQEYKKTVLLLQDSLDQLTQVLQLEKALSSCREELNSSWKKMDEAKEHYQRQLDLRSQELLGLQEDLQSSSLVCRRSGEQCAQLQGMLQESSARVAELEDSQSQLQGAVSVLEKELEQTLSRREKEVHDADKEVQKERRQAALLSGSVNQLSSEMNKCRGELSVMEQELQKLRRDASMKSSQISHMEEALLKTQDLLEQKNHAVLDLEAKLHCSEQDRLNSVQQAEVLEGQLQAVRSELHDTLGTLQELRDLLQRTQLTAEEREISLEKLSAELRENQKELEQRTHEMLDLDAALKDQQGELQQRAQLLGQLDVAIREHKLEMDMKVQSLKQVLDKREREIKDKDRQVEFLSEKVDLLKTQVQMKEDVEKNSVEQCQNLSLCREQLQRTQHDLQDTRRHCENLRREVDAITQHANDKETQVRSLEEELSAREQRWVQEEASLQATVASVKQELEHEREEHSKEVSSLQQTRGQLLKVSEQMSCSLRSSQEHLASRLHQSQLQLEQASAQAARLQAQLHISQSSLQNSQEALLIKESELTRLQARISSLDRTTELHRTTFHHPELRHPSSPVSPRPAHQPDPPHPPQELTPGGSADSSLGLTPSLKATLREALAQHLPWDTALSPSPSLQHLDLSWQGLSRPEDASASDLSFNPLTYMVDRTAEEVDPGVDLPPRQQTQEEMDMSSLTGMLRFVNQTLALQEDPSLWGSTGLSEDEHTLTSHKGDLIEGGCGSTRNL
ncbi:hypothetical protein UPYG_G00298450 [Umbra pygmaea]|uniref:Coiled-coil domain containing 18 n=1 Tax=Umbra pygmaea TaxID=75934 RepID=A0ABD0WVN3_UMBPY